MKIKNLWIVMLSVTLVFGLMFTGCGPEPGPEPGDEWDTVGTLSELKGTWNSSVGINIPIRNYISEVLDILPEDIGLSITIDDLDDIKGLFISLYNEYEDDTIDDIDWEDFLAFIEPECYCEECDCYWVCDCADDVSPKDIFEMLDINDWNDLQGFIDGVLGISVNADVNITLVIRDDDMDVKINSASIGLSGNYAGTIFSLLDDIIDVFIEDPDFEGIMEYITISENTISLKDEIFLFEELEIVNEDISDLGFLINEDKNKVKIPLAQLLQDPEITISSSGLGISEIVFTKQ